MQRISGALRDGRHAQPHRSLQGPLRARTLFFAIVGEATDDGQLVSRTRTSKTTRSTWKWASCSARPPNAEGRQPLGRRHAELDLSGIELADAIDRVLRFPAVANKNFLITIADRSITGMVTRDRWSAPGRRPLPMSP